jgi:hypothetical protein
MIKSVSVLFVFILILSIIPLSISFLLNKSYKRTKIILYCITGCFALAQGWLWLDDVSGWQTHRHFKNIQVFFDQPSQGFKKEFYSRGFAIIALSNIADGLVNYGRNHPDKHDEITQLFRKVIQLATTPDMPLYSDPGNPAASGENGLYLSHLNIILGAYQQFSSDTQYLFMNQQISEYLAQTTIQDAQKHVRSFPNQPYKWPADQAATLYSLYLFDLNNQTQLSVKPIHEWIEYMRAEGTAPTMYLHYSEVSRKIDYWKYPRGCALSWTVKYMSKFAPEEARKLWENYKQHYKHNYLLIAGFREYPVGVQQEPNIDSGPIIFGNGASATAFGLAASKAMGDVYTYYQIQNAAHFADAVIWLLSCINSNHELVLVSRDLLATSIRFSSETQI